MKFAQIVAAWFRCSARAAISLTGSLVVLVGIGELIPMRTSAAVSGPTPWVVIKCKFSDQTQPPQFNTEIISALDGMAGYWSDVSYNQIQLTGTLITDWYTLPFTAAEAAQRFPGSEHRAALIDECVRAATGVDVSQYYSVMAILGANLPIPHGLGNSGAAGGRVVLEPRYWNNSFMAHEMGHGYGLGHSFSDTGVEYGDGWDIMSAMTFGNSNPTFVNRFGSSGPGLNAPNLETLGWMPANRVFSYDGHSRTVALAALNHPEAPGYFVARVGGFDYLTIEFRSKTNWDRAITQDAVLIHKVGLDRRPYLITDQGGAERLPGETYRYADGNVNVIITVVAINGTTATISIGPPEFWVDFNWPGAPNFPEDGSHLFPFSSLAEGVTASAWGGTVKLKPGSSTETININKRVTLDAVGGLVTIGRRL